MPSASGSQRALAVRGKKKELSEAARRAGQPQTAPTPRDPRASGASGPAAVKESARRPAAPPAAAAAPPSGSEPAGGLISRPENTDPYRFWDQYLKTHPIDGNTLMANLIRLRRENRFKDVEAAIRGFLRHRTKDPAPWLYEMLATAIEMNKGNPRDVETALGYAADQAMKSALPADLTRVADELAIRKMYDRSAALLDRAMTTDPSAPQPIWMAISLAARTKDPQRMGDAVERLLALGWPGADTAYRLMARKQVDDLAKTLREDGRDADAQALLDRMPEAEARDLVIRLTWSGDADLDLAVEEPLGATARVATPRTVFGGAIVKNGYGKYPEEIYVGPRLFSGDYKVRIETIYNDRDNPAHEIALEITTHEGTEREETRTESIDLENREPIVIHLEAGRRTTVLPFRADPPAEPAAPPPTRRRSLAVPTPAEAADALRSPAATQPKRPANPAPK